MDPTTIELLHRVSALEAQMAAMLANLDWLTKLAWMLLASSVGSIILNGLQIKNGKRKSG